METQRSAIIAKEIKLKNQSGASLQQITDSFGRSFPYLRLSITDVCNFRCSYCLPNGYQKNNHPPHLSIDEINRLIRAFAFLGVYKVRLTGGEPTTRKDFSDIAQTISKNPSIKQLAFTTNGYTLYKNAQLWRESGLTHLNISIDSLKPELFYKITGHPLLNKVLKGVDAALDYGFESIKINVVLLKNVNDNEFEQYLEWAKKTPISIRYIELMQTGDNFAYFQKYHLSAQSIREKLEKKGWVKEKRKVEEGPAEVYSHSDYLGRVGLIAPYSKDFCKSCNRLRVTSTGGLRLCLFGSQGVSLRHFLQSDEQLSEVIKLIQAQMKYKVSSHFLAFGDTGITPHLASIGG